MPRYYFDTYDGRFFATDDEGQELEGVSAAKAVAQTAVVEMAKDEIPDGDERTFLISVRDQVGREVLRIALSLMVEALGDHPTTPFR
ncbi:DUF6894 family protein [Microvirga sp. M2]|uniref:DUF6894 family protein n=1 Tax=Microvirga sp. M2 TaxID=3073270 RepID=UPI0039C37341